MAMVLLGLKALWTENITLMNENLRETDTAQYICTIWACFFSLEEHFN